jgi:hypothetical protein
MVVSIPDDLQGGEMFRMTRKMLRRRRIFTGLVLGFATVGVFAGTGSAKPLEQQYYEARYGTSHLSQDLPNSGIVSKSLIEQHLLNEERAGQLANGGPNYSHLPAEDRAAIFARPAQSDAKVTAAPSGGGFDRGDWMRGIALAALLVSASAFATIMVRGGVRTAHS